VVQADLCRLARRRRPDDYVQRHDHIQARAGQPILPRSKAHILGAARTFFRDLQEWDWIGRRFDPARALAVPRTVAALIGTDPRVIADDVWAKLLWAGLNLEPADLPGNSAGTYYPMELIHAITLTWLFAGLRSDEIHRLRVGCIRWQHDGQPITGDSADVLADDAVCLLDVPVHKTGTAFTKPVDPIIGQAIDAWQTLRPGQPPGSTARPARPSTCCSASALSRSPATTSTTRSSRRYAPKPGCRPPTSAAPLPATGHDRRSPASSTTPRNR
jgi:integrase